MITTEFDDIDQISSFFTNWDGTFEQLSRGRFAGTIRATQGQMARVVTLTANQVFLARGVGDPSLLTFLPVTPTNANARWQGRELSPGHLVVQGPEVATDHRSARDYEVFMLSLPIHTFSDAARSLLASDQEGYPREWESRSLAPRSIGRLFDSITQLLENQYEPGSPEAIQCEEECVRAAVLAVAPRSDQYQGKLSLPARTNLVRRAEELFRANLAEPIGNVAVCSELGVSDRTLRLAFKERFGMGPMAFYKQIRLNAAHNTLKSGEATSVRAVARRFGFHHFSNFAADYRRAFGKLPSRTFSD